MKKLILLFAAAGLLASCVKSNIKGTDPVVSDFDWKTTKSVSISVSTPAVETKYQSFATTVKVYSKPYYVNRYLVTEGAAYTGKPYSTQVDIPEGVDTLYVWAKLPTGGSTFYKYVISGTKAVAVTRNTLSTKSAMYSKTVTYPSEIQAPASYTATYTKVGSTESNYMTNNGGNYLLSGNMTIGNGNTGFLGSWNSSKPIVLYVSGTVKVQSLTTALGYCTIVVLPGGSLTFYGKVTTNTYNSAGVKIDVHEGGSLTVKSLEANGANGANVSILNYGSITVSSYFSSFSAAVLNKVNIYNAGTFIMPSGSGAIEFNNGANFYNSGNFEGEEIWVHTGDSGFENETTGTASCKNVILDNSVTAFVNKGFFTCSDTFDSQGTNVTITNSGYLAMNNFTPDGTKINCSDGSLLNITTLSTVKNSTFTLEGGAMVNIDKYVTTDVYKCLFTNKSDTDYALVTIGTLVDTGNGVLVADPAGKLPSASVLFGWQGQGTNFTGAVEVYYPNAADAAESATYTHGACNNGTNVEGPAFFGHDRVNNIPETPYNHGAGVIDTTDPNDKDGDGVPNTDDAFPEDPELAYVSYFPSENVFGTYVFEDLWSDIGDYDLNDIVWNFNIGYYKNAQNKVVYMNIKWKLAAAGTSMLLAGGVQLDGVTPSQVSSVVNDNTGLTDLPIGHSLANGCEAGETYAVFPFFNDPGEVFGGVRTFVNTGSTGGNDAAAETHNTKVTFASPLSEVSLGMDKFNMFITASKNFVKTERGKEIHLMNFGPTSLVDSDLIKYLQANPSSTNWMSEDNPYRLSNGLVWALMVPQEFRWVKEGCNVASVYTKYITWYSSTETDQSAKYWYDTSVDGNVSNEDWLY